MTHGIDHRSYDYSQSVTYEQANGRLIAPDLAGAITTPKVFNYFTQKNFQGTQMLFEQDLSELCADYLEDNPNANIDDFDQVSEALAERHSFLAAEIELLDDEEHRAAYQSEKEFLEEFLGNLMFVEKVRDIIKSFANDSDDPRQIFVNGIFLDYVSLFDETEQDQIIEKAESGSITTILDFIRFYKKQIEIENNESNIGEKLQEWRGQYANFLQNGAAGTITNPLSLERAVHVVQTIPIIVKDPLSTLSELSPSVEIYGSFNPAERVIAVDPYTIEIANRRQLAGLGTHNIAIYSERLDVFIRQVLTHEFIHAYTNERYYDIVSAIIPDFDPKSLVGSKQLTMHDQWQQFWYEGITEKLSFSHLGDMIGEGMEDFTVTGTDLEPLERLDIDTRFPQYDTIISNNGLQLKRYLKSTYHDFRILIDTVFNGLDWSAAGIDQKQAESLAVNAFAELPQDIVNPSESQRLAFIQALNQASHPGFYMKLGHLVGMCKPTELAAMLSDASFDPHDPMQTPFIATASYGQVTETAPKAMEKDFEKFQRTFMRPGYNKEVIDPIAEQYKVIIAELQTKASLLRITAKSLNILIDYKHGNTPDSAMRRQFTDGDPSEFTRKIKLWQRYLDAERESIAQAKSAPNSRRPANVPPAEPSVQS